MNIQLLLEGLIHQSTELEVAAIAMDSRVVKPQSLFIALAKDTVMRAKHIEQAIQSGACCVLVTAEQALTDQEQQLLATKQLAVFAIDDLANKVSLIAGRFYGEPSTSMTVIAVTGTNGKTSVSHFIAQLLTDLGHNTAVIGTLGVGKLNQLLDTGMTTPDPVLVQQKFAEFKQQGIRYVVMEASSHALEQSRLAAIDIDVAVLTNLSRDHLDYHQTMHKYQLAKRKLFEFASVKAAVINQQDQFGQSLLSLLGASQCAVYAYSDQQQTDQAVICANAVKVSQSGLEFELQHADFTSRISSKLLGLFNVNNLLASYAVLVALGFDKALVAEKLIHCEPVAGRMQHYTVAGKANVIIDFAHTPDALAKALGSLRQHITSQGQLWCVFGCGGDRDKGKRAQMGEVAEHYADKLVLTADNPRSENNAQIVADILQGIKVQEQVYIEHDRTAAIHYALEQASEADLILVAGKGHESYQEVAGIKHDFSDQQVVNEYIAAANDRINMMRAAS